MADRKRRLVQEESDDSSDRISAASSASSSASSESSSSSSASSRVEPPGYDPNNPTWEESITWPHGPVELSESTGRSVFLLFLHNGSELQTVRIPTRFISEDDLKELNQYVDNGYVEKQEDFGHSYVQESAVGRLCARCGIFIMDWEKARDLEEYVTEQYFCDSDKYDQELLSPYAVVLLLGDPDLASGDF